MYRPHKTHYSRRHRLQDSVLPPTDLPSSTHVPNLVVLHSSHTPSRPPFPDRLRGETDRRNPTPQTLRPLHKKEDLIEVHGPEGVGGAGVWWDLETPERDTNRRVPTWFGSHTYRGPVSHPFPTTVVLYPGPVWKLCTNGDRSSLPRPPPSFFTHPRPTPGPRTVDPLESESTPSIPKGTTGRFSRAHLGGRGLGDHRNKGQSPRPKSTESRTTSVKPPVVFTLVLTKMVDTIGWAPRGGEGRPSVVHQTIPSYSVGVDKSVHVSPRRPWKESLRGKGVSGGERKNPQGPGRPGPTLKVMCVRRDRTHITLCSEETLERRTHPSNLDDGGRPRIVTPTVCLVPW